MSDTIQLRTIDATARPSVADMVFDELHGQVLALELPPGTKLSEVDVARQMGVSRQPVRDAFYRLSKLGFLLIRPQRATTISQISVNAVRQARFIRTALEIETVRLASERLSDDDLAQLQVLIDRQRAAMEANDRVGFHALDDQFHKEICERADLGFAWDMIRENKAHMDRVRYLSLAFASQTAFDDHLEILAALNARNGVAAVAAMRIHLGRILGIIDRIRDENQAWFAEEDQ